jgi:hypothetical protein
MYVGCSLLLRNWQPIVMGTHLVVLSKHICSSFQDSTVRFFIYITCLQAIKLITRTSPIFSMHRQTYYKTFCSSVASHAPKLVWLYIRVSSSLLVVNPSLHLVFNYQVRLVQILSAEVSCKSEAAHFIATAH